MTLVEPLSRKVHDGRPVRRDRRAVAVDRDGVADIGLDRRRAFRAERRVAGGEGRGVEAGDPRTTAVTFALRPASTALAVPTT